jgi:hypothetical protein
VSIIRSSFNVHSAMVYVIQVCRQLSSRTRMERSSILVLLDDGQRNCPKHVDFHAKNNISEISASSWFYYKEICYDARSHERGVLQHTTSTSGSIPVMHFAVTCFCYPKCAMGPERVIQQMACVWHRISGVELSNPLIPTTQETAAFQIKL